MLVAAGGEGDDVRGTGAAEAQGSLCLNPTGGGRSFTAGSPAGQARKKCPGTSGAVSVFPQVAVAPEPPAPKESRANTFAKHPAFPWSHTCGDVELPPMRAAVTGSSRTSIVPGSP